MKSQKCAFVVTYISQIFIRVANFNFRTRGSLCELSFAAWRYGREQTFLICIEVMSNWLCRIEIPRAWQIRSRDILLEKRQFCGFFSPRLLQLQIGKKCLRLIEKIKVQLGSFRMLRNIYLCQLLLRQSYIVSFTSQWVLGRLAFLVRY